MKNKAVFHPILLLLKEESLLQIFSHLYQQTYRIHFPCIPYHDFYTVVVVHHNILESYNRL